MKKTLSTIWDYFFHLLLIFILVLFVLFLSYYMMLRNITVKVCKEAEITGVITSKFVNETYSTNPLSKISGTFQIEEINPGLDVPAHRLGDKLNIKISKTLSFAGHSIKITAKGKAVNQGYYGAGYRKD